MKPKYALYDPVWAIHPVKFLRSPAQIHNISPQYPYTYTLQFYKWPILEYDQFKLIQSLLTPLEDYSSNEYSFDIEIHESYKMAKSEQVRRKFEMMREQSWWRQGSKQWGILQLNKFLNQMLYLQCDEYTMEVAQQRLKCFECKRSQSKMYFLLQICPIISYIINEDQLEPDLQHTLSIINSQIKQLLLSHYQNGTL